MADIEETETEREIIKIDPLRHPNPRKVPEPIKEPEPVRSPERVPA
jgi:hypothetical protein